MKHAESKFRISAIIGCLVAQLSVGILYLWSVYKADTMDYYGWSNSAVNMVPSIMFIMFCLGNLAGGALQDRTSPRLSAVIGIFVFSGGLLSATLIPAGGSIFLFYLFYCVIGGLGCGFVYASALNCIQRWLPHRRGLATGLAASAFGLSTAVFSPVSSALLHKMPMPLALRTMAGCLFVIGFVACLFIVRPDAAYLSTIKRPEKKVQSVRSDEESLPLSRAMRTVPFWLLFLSMFFYNGTWNMLTPLIKGLGLERGLPEAIAVLTVSLTGITNAAGRLVMSPMSDRIGRRPAIMILCTLTLVCALGLTAVSGGVYSVFVLMTAFAYGAPAAIMPAFCTDIFGAKYSGANYGVVNCGAGCSAVLFNVISNCFYELTGTYTLSFLLGGATAVVTMGLMCGIKRYLKNPARI